MTTPTRWAILGTGRIAAIFAEGLKALEDAQLVAAGSRTQEKADAFADRFDIPRRHASYQALAADPDVDVVYIATPHSMHKENTILCLKANKAVLCEKPFAINAIEARAAIDVARATDLFLMEAMWTRFLPAMVQVRQWIDAGAIGAPRMVTADFGFRSAVNPESRLFNPALGGGALLDVGVYTISLAAMVLGSQPARITGLAHLGETGVDEQAGMVLAYPEGQLAVLSTSVRASTPGEARIVGEEGTILIDPPFFRATRTHLRAGNTEESADFPFEGNGYNYQAAEVGRCLRNGKLESEIMPLEETIALMQIMDELRTQWGLKYPME